MKLLLTGAFQYTERQMEMLKDMGHDLCYIQDERIPLKEQKMEISLEEIEGVVCNGLFLYNDIEQFESLRFIQLTSAGFDRVSMEYITQKGIAIHNARGVYSVPMAEWAVWSALELYKNMAEFRQNQKAHLWKKQRNLQELAEKKVLLLGCGNVACEVAKRFKAFDTKIKGIDKYPRPLKHFDEVLGLDYVDEQLKDADIVISTLPLTQETYHLLNYEKLSLLGDNSIVINISRGQVIDEDALIKVLTKKEILGAALDVFETEPLNEQSPLWDLKNVIVTPHNSFVSDKNNERMFKLILENLQK